ncbi:sugar-binding transcriptional regulator [Mycobacterium sp. NPDC003449]
MAEDHQPDHHLDRRVDEALRVAQRYYLHGATMDVIARQMGTSRSTVSRLLQYARDSGLVEIRVLPPDSRAHPLEQSLAESFGVRAHVAHVPSTATTVERLERTAVEAARLLHSIFESDMIIAISWGTMVNAISECLIAKPTTNCQFVQLNGMGFSRTTGGHYANSIMARFGEAFSGYVRQFPVPVFFDRAEIKVGLLEERSIKGIISLQHSADVVLFNVGTVTAGMPSSPYLNGYFLDDVDFAALAADGAIGDIATSYLRQDGSHSGIRLNARTSGPDLDKLRMVKHRICAVSGDHKIDALDAALAGGYITELVIDELTAGLLLERYQGATARRR